MPSDANGNYSLPNGYLAITGTTVQPSQHNPPLEDLAEAMTGRLPKNGAAPMTGPIKLVAGTESLPGLTWAAGPGTGFYKSADGIGVSVNGAKVAELTAQGLRSGGFHVGQLIATTRSGALPLTVQPYGQTLSRTTYAELWAVAQAEIAAGNLFYNNGDGATTFGIGDLRNRVLAAKGDMGGSSSGRLSAAYFGADGEKIGSVGGGESISLSVTHMPSHNHGGATGFMDRANPHTHATSGQGIGATGGFDIGVYSPNGPITYSPPSLGSADINHLHSIAAQGSGTAFSRVQPTMICNFLLFTGV